MKTYQAAAGCALSSFTNQGEVCLCTERIYVHESIYDEFLEKFKHEGTVRKNLNKYKIFFSFIL